MGILYKKIKPFTIIIFKVVIMLSNHVKDQNWENVQFYKINFRSSVYLDLCLLTCF